MDSDVKDLYDKVIDHELVKKVSVGEDEDKVKVTIGFPHPPDKEMIDSLERDFKDLAGSSWSVNNGVENEGSKFVSYFVKSY